MNHQEYLEPKCFNKNTGMDLLGGGGGCVGGGGGALAREGGAIFHDKAKNY